MTRRRTVLTLGVLAFLLLPLSFAQAPSTRNIQGKVVGTGGVPLSGAIVYLENSKTSNIESFITTKDGSYLFGYTSTDIDYTIWAAYKGKKSETKTVSSYNTRDKIYLDLHIKSS
jgi:Carboxypeptidase regulatory-like domain